MSQVQACSALSMAESAAHSEQRRAYTYRWDALDQALAEGRRDVCGNIDAQNSQGSTALHIAANAGRTSTVRALVAAGASLNLRDEPGWTPLARACGGGHHECVAALVAAGADLNVTFNDEIKETALSAAAEYSGSVRCIQILLDAGAPVNGPRDAWSGLHGAVWGSRRNKTKSEDCISTLLKAGADINAVDHLRRSPLHLAMVVETDQRLEHHPCRLVATLLRNGARLEAPDELPTEDIEGELETRATMYVDAVRFDGGIVRYEKMRRAPFITALTRCFPLPSDTIPLIVEFWVRRALEY